MAETPRRGSRAGLRSLAANEARDKEAHDAMMADTVRAMRREPGFSRAAEDTMRQQAEAERFMERSLMREPSMDTENARGLMRALGRDDGMKRGGVVKKMAAGGKVRGDGICSKGKTKGRFI